MAFGSDWVGVCRCYLILVLFYSVKDFQNTVVLQWLSANLCFREVIFAVQHLYCKASALRRNLPLLRLSIWTHCSVLLAAFLFIPVRFANCEQVRDLSADFAGSDVRAFRRLFQHSLQACRC